MRDYLSAQILAALDTMGGAPDGFEVEFQQPNNPDHGDLATNAALQLARHFRKAPRAIADELAAQVELDPEQVSSVEVAGPGFLNFRFAPAYLSNALRGMLKAGSGYGRVAPTGKTAIVEFVSANPTGPLTVGHGRNAVLGDTLATLLQTQGFAVTREYYFNDAGRQMRVLGDSVAARYNALADPGHASKEIEAAGGETITVPESFPEDGYQGDYIQEIARTLFETHGAGLDDAHVFRRAAQERIFEEIEGTLGRMGIHMDGYFNERTVYESGAIWEIVDALKDKGLAFEKDGAVWFKTTEFGKDQDTVLVKSSGEPTYRLPDIAYHIDKVKRGFDRIVDIFGADHIATFPDVLSGVQAMGHATDGIHVVIYQFVTLVRGGEPVKMSTRKATYVTLDDLMDEVGEDVTRFFFLMRSPNTHLEFDLDLAKEAGEKNPVFYLQYAHARIASIIRKAEEVGLQAGGEADLTLLVHEAEENLIKELMRYPAVLKRSAASYEPHRLATYLREVAVAFTQFYGNCRIIGEEEGIAVARLQLARAAQQVLASGLGVLGISAPERM
ncbi:MAG: arginine--tRNA ligase [Rhodothermales bacterium]|nr:arginine--tRNA ligase [Rhodothermales bacterium]MBO6779090.1 arginine--tRNA ligase [Rhodothermales bacterium]